jgi:hypothetical protein
VKSSAARGAPVAMSDHAEATLRYIRSSMDAASGVETPGSAGISVGLVGVLAAVAAAGPWRPQWLTVWLTAAPVACAVGAAVMARQQHLHGRTLFGPSGRRFMLCLAPALLVGAILTAVDLRDGNLQVLAGTWLLLYGCAVVTASAITIQLVAWLGALFMALGVVALLLPVSTHNLLLGLGFGGLHLLFGTYLVAWKSRGR